MRNAAEYIASFPGSSGGESKSLGTRVAAESVNIHCTCVHEKTLLWLYHRSRNLNLNGGTQTKAYGGSGACFNTLRLHSGDF